MKVKSNPTEQLKLLLVAAEDFYSLSVKFELVPQVCHSFDDPSLRKELTGIGSFEERSFQSTQVSLLSRGHYWDIKGQKNASFSMHLTSTGQVLCSEFKKLSTSRNCRPCSKVSSFLMCWKNILTNNFLNKQNKLKISTSIPKQRTDAAMKTSLTQLFNQETASEWNKGDSECSTGKPLC